MAARTDAIASEGHSLKTVALDVSDQPGNASANVVRLFSSVTELPQILRKPGDEVGEGGGRSGCGAAWHGRPDGHGL